MGGVCASQFGSTLLASQGKRLPSTFSQCLQKASGLRFGAPPASFVPPRLFAPGLGVPAASDRPLHVVAAAQVCRDWGSHNLTVSVYDARLVKDEAGKLCLGAAEEDPRVFVVPRWGTHFLSPFEF
eukprot:s5125_g1.t1